MSQEIILEKALRLVESYMSNHDTWEQPFQATMASSEITDMFSR